MKDHISEGQRDEDRKRKPDSRVSLELETGKVAAEVTSGGENMGYWRDHCYLDWAWGAAGLKMWFQKQANELGK